MSVVKFPISSGDCAKNEPSGACPLGVVPTGAAWNDGWFSYDIRVDDWFWLVPTYHSPFFLHMFDGLYVGNGREHGPTYLVWDWRHDRPSSSKHILQI